MRRFVLPALLFACAAVLAAQAAVRHDAPAGMVWIPGREFTMGSHGPRSHPDEQPAHRVRLNGFWMDATDVTNAQFRSFVEATGYVTTAERAPSRDDVAAQLPPGVEVTPEMLVPGSLVFHRPTADAPGRWEWTPGASWRHPEPRCGRRGGVSKFTPHPTRLGHANTLAIDAVNPTGFVW